MGQLVIQNKQIVLPGQELAHGMDYLPAQGAYRDGDIIYSGRLGLVSVDGRALKIIPLSGIYLPKRYDIILAKVIDVTLSGWILDINSAYPAMLGMKEATSEYINRGEDLTKYFTFGDYIVCKIVNVTSQKLVDVTTRGPGLNKLRNGRVIKVAPSKVPRIIGKQGSMISMVKQATDCKIIVGQNGAIWIDGTPENEILAVDTIEKIGREAHISGLTDVIKRYLEEKTGKKIEATADREGE